jgi:hypothetical protein
VSLALRAACSAFRTSTSSRQQGNSCPLRFEDLDQLFRLAHVCWLSDFPIRNPNHRPAWPERCSVIVFVFYGMERIFDGDALASNRLLAHTIPLKLAPLPAWAARPRLDRLRRLVRAALRAGEGLGNADRSGTGRTLDPGLDIPSRRHDRHRRLAGT